MKFKSFSELNEVIADKMSDVEIFSGEHFSYFKVVQHALTYSENDFTNKLLRSRLNDGSLVVRLLYLIKSILRPTKVRIHTLTDILILDQGRTGLDEQKQHRSVYFDTIVQTIGRDRCSIMLTDTRSELEGFDLTIDELAPLRNRSLARMERVILKDIIRVIGCIDASGRFSVKEMAYIRACFQVFFEEFHMYYQFLLNQPTKQILTDTHYHKEGAICAMKILGIRVVEIQHGLVAGNDLYYVYDAFVAPIRKKALFPDLLLLYGEYWKRLLLRGHEHSQDELVVVGDYNFKKEEAQMLSLEKENVLFIAAQKNMPEYYVEYTTRLLQMMQTKHPEWKVQLKLHPIEKQPELYTPLLEYKNFELVGNESDLLQLLAVAKIQVSIYSTTFYDALGLDVINFSIQDFSPSRDYAADIIKEDVAVGISFNDDPINHFSEIKQKDIAFLSRSDVYAEFEPQKLLKTLSA
jgi:hypothetical protein